MSNTTTSSVKNAIKGVILAGSLVMGSVSCSATSTPVVRAIDIKVQNMPIDSKHRYYIEKSTSTKNLISIDDSIHFKMFRSLEDEIGRLEKLQATVLDVKAMEIMQKYSDEVSKYPDLLVIDHNEAKVRFSSVTNLIKNLPYNAVYVQLKEDNAFKYNFNFADDIELMMTVGFTDEDDLSIKNALFTVVKDDDIVYSGIYEINEFVEAFPKYLV